MLGSLYYQSTTQQSGKFRFRRQGSTLNIYHWDELTIAWVALPNGGGVGPTDDLRLKIAGYCQVGSFNCRAISLTHNGEGAVNARPPWPPYRKS